MENSQKQTPLQKAIKEIEDRIKYLKAQEFIALNEIDALVAPSLARDMKWKLINELATRRGELERYSLKPLQSLLPYEQECFIGAFNSGVDTGTLLSDTRAADYDSALDYFNQTYKHPPEESKACDAI